jgi:hypothetical protein
VRQEHACTMLPLSFLEPSIFPFPCRAKNNKRYPRSILHTNCFSLFRRSGLWSLVGPRVRTSMRATEYCLSALLDAMPAKLPVAAFSLVMVEGGVRASCNRLAPRTFRTTVRQVFEKPRSTILPLTRGPPRDRHDTAWLSLHASRPPPCAGCSLRLGCNA